MTYELSNQEKINIITEHLKTLEMNKFDLNISLSECYSSDTDRSDDINILNDQINQINKQQDALSQEMATLNLETGII
jgi:chromosome segregation ATPase